MEALPVLINSEVKIQENFPLVDEKEANYIREAQGLFAAEFYSYSLLAVWNAAINNLKRKVEAYGIDLWISVVQGEQGRKKYDATGETIAERWSNVDDLVLISGATKLRLLNPKAGKSLEMINWMRNHASPAHDSDNRVEKEDAVGLILLLQKNLFDQPIPNPGHSVASIFDPVKNKNLSEDELRILEDQIKSYKNQDIRNVFGFFLDLIARGEEPAKTNTFKLFPFVWEKATDDVKKALGIKYHTYVIDPNSDTSNDKGAKTRFFELLVNLNAVRYIPDGTRARIFRRAAEKLTLAKNTSYGWKSEEAASRNLIQLGTCIPSVAFEEVYQEILSVWFGNYWGRSDSHTILKPFIDSLNTDQIRNLIKLFRTNERIIEELSSRRPKENAIIFLEAFSDRLTIEAHKQELLDIIQFVKKL